MAYLFSVLSFIILLLIFKNFSYTLNLIDKPNYRKKHKGDIPLIGGIIIYKLVGLMGIVGIGIGYGNYIFLYKKKNIKNYINNLRYNWRHNWIFYNYNYLF